jgi:hypothetical protein
LNVRLGRCDGVTALERPENAHPARFQNWLPLLSSMAESGRDGELAKE